MPPPPLPGRCQLALMTLLSRARLLRGSFPAPSLWIHPVSRWSRVPRAAGRVSGPTQARLPSGSHPFPPVEPVALGWAPGSRDPGSRGMLRAIPGGKKNPPKVPFFCSAMGINERLWGKIRGKRDPGGRSAGAAAPTRGLPLSIDPAFPWDAEAHLDWEGATSTAPNSIGNGAVNPILASRRESGEGRMRTFQEPPPAGPEFPFHPRSRAPGAWKSGISDENGNNWI